MKFSERVTSIPESGIRAMFSLAQKATDIVNLSIGEPDFDTPDHIKTEAGVALKEGYTHYAPTKGILDLLDAIATKLKNENNVEVDPKNEVIVTIGGGQAVHLALSALLQEGDEVIIPSPAFVLYAAATRLLGGVPIEVSLKKDYTLDAEAIQRKITDRTKVVVVNSPSNPTGAVTPPSELKKIAESLEEKKEIYVLSDEVYEKFIYEGLNLSLASIAGIKQRVVTINSFSKTFGMTGWRIGYAAGSSDLIDQMAKVQTYTCACVPTFIQKAAVKALESPQDFFDNIRKEFQKRRDFLCTRLSGVSGLSFTKPKGAFYLFPQLLDLKMSSAEFAKGLLTNAKVAVIPGSVFGAGGENHIRISYAASQEKIEQGATRISKYLESVLT